MGRTAVQWASDTGIGSVARTAGADPFRLLVESVADYAIFMLDPAGYVLTWNLGAESLKGYRADEIIGRHFSTFYTPEFYTPEEARSENHERIFGRFERVADATHLPGWGSASGSRSRSSGPTGARCASPRASRARAPPLKSSCRASGES